MRLRLVTATATILVVQPALAHPDNGSAAMPEEREAPYIPYDSDVNYAFDPAAREAWLADCSQRLSARDSSLGGAVIGGTIGGVAGNRIAGNGNRTVGTVAGAVVGAAVGAAVDRSEDARRHRDECETYLADYYMRYTHGGGHYPPDAYGHGRPRGYVYGPPAYAHPALGCCAVPRPVAMSPVAHAEPECIETIEYVYEDVPTRPAPRKRYIPKPSKVVPDKRVPIK